MTESLRFKSKNLPKKDRVVPESRTVKKKIFLYNRGVNYSAGNFEWYFLFILTFFSLRVGALTKSSFGVTGAFEECRNWMLRFVILLNVNICFWRYISERSGLWTIITNLKIRDLRLKRTVWNSAML